jgi:hypothetical protein
MRQLVLSRARCLALMATLSISPLVLYANSVASSEGLGQTSPSQLTSPLPSTESLPLPFGDCRIGIWSGTRNLDDDAARLKTTCLAQWRVPIGADFRASLGARAGFADAPNSASGGSSHHATMRLREGYIEYERDFLRARAGRQIIAWGRADRINPTDNLSPRDFTFLSQEDDEQRDGINAVAVDMKAGSDWSASTVFVPRFEPHTAPVGALPNGIVVESRAAKPEFGLKLDRIANDVDFSVSYYRGFDRFARYRLKSITTAGPLLQASFDRQQTLGADIAFNIGKVGFRAEAASSRYQAGSASPHEADRTINRAVAGVDRTIFDTANLGIQLFSIYRVGYQRAVGQTVGMQRLNDGLDRLNSEFAHWEKGATMRVSDRFLNERMRIELSAVYDFSGRSYILRPRLAYSFSDGLRLSAGADYFYGDERSYFGARHKNNLAYVELAWIF